MPVRNWWIDVDIDGRKTELAGGPRSKEGGFSLRIFQREDGGIIQAGSIYGRVNHEGKLVLEGSINGQEVTLITER